MGGLRESLKGPTQSSGTKKISEEDIQIEKARHDGASGLRELFNRKESASNSNTDEKSHDVLKDIEKEANIETNISHSNEEGITQIQVKSESTEDNFNDSNEVENELSNLKNMTDLIRRKLDDKSNQRESNQGPRYSFSTVTEFKTFQSTEEIKETVAGDLLKTRSAIKKKRTVIIQQTIVMIVESVSNWLDKVDYRISTVKKIKTINQKKQELKSIKEEIEVIEETVDELVEVTEMAVEVIDDESKVTVTSCVSCLKDQAKVVKLYHQQSEDELSDSEDRWEEYVEGIKTIERL